MNEKGEKKEGWRRKKIRKEKRRRERNRDKEKKERREEYIDIEDHAGPDK